MYNSLLIPWSDSTNSSTTSQEELELEREYRLGSPHRVRTRGTIFLPPPPRPILKESYNSPPRPRSRMSAGAVALCKHFERDGAGRRRRSSAEHNRAHPYWPLPRGSNEDKTQMAAEVLARMWGEIRWENVMLLHPGVAVYEVRNRRGWGMRWTLVLLVEDDEETTTTPDGGSDNEREDVSSKKWKISKTTFRGFVEPIEGLDHELDNVEATELSLKWS